MRRKQNETKPRITVLCERLSREDSGAGDSISIQNQKIKLESYAAEHGFTNAVHYTDDGYSGASFQRPAWNQLMEDIKARRIGTVIVKDMSRVGRNYLEVGYFTEVIFPQYGVRFIAIDSAVDSADQTSTEYAPIMNLVNEWFVKDFSERMKAAWKAKRIAGEHTCTVCMYGYRKDPDNPDYWLIDEEAAQVVRHIFRLALEGKGPGEIARILHDKQVEKPSYYRAKRQPSFTLPERPYDWDSSVVSTMLRSREYIGMTVNHKTIRPTYKSRSKIEKLDRSQWQFVEGTQEPIVSEELFNAVQEKLSPRPAQKSIEGTNPLTGLVYCADCGCKMRNHRRRGKPLKSDPTKLGAGDDAYLCTTSENAANYRETGCSPHRISTKALRAIVLEDIRAASQSAIEDEAAFREKILHESEAKRNEATKEMEKKLRQDKARYEELDDLFQSLYESNHAGRISDRRFQMLSERYEKEQAELEQSIAQMERELSTLHSDEANVDRFIQLCRRYTDLSELTTSMLNEYVDKILVHEAEKIDGERDQEVEVCLNYIGKFELPEPDLTPAELEALEKDKARRAKQREYCKAYRERKRQKKAQEQAADKPDDAA